MSSPESEFRQAVKRLAAAQDRKYQTKPGPPVQADVTDVNTETGYVTVQAQGQPAQIYVGATAAMYKSGDTLLVQQTNVDATHPEYTVAKPVKQDLVRTVFADPNPDLAAPGGFSVTSGTQQPTPGGYQAYADVSLNTVTTSYNYYADGVTRFHVYAKLSTDLAWGAPVVIDMPATRPGGRLAAAITAGATTITVSMITHGLVTPQPPYRGRCQIEGESIDYTSLSVSGSTYTLSGCTRGADSTSAAAHSISMPVLFHSVFGRIGGLAINRGYDFKAAAVKADWEGPYTAVASLTTAIDTTAPSTPTGIAVALQRSGAQVAWNPVSDADVGVGGYYTVYRNSSASESGATTHQVAATSYFWGNNDGSGWWFGVKAVDSAGNASGSSWAQDTLPPAAPSGLTVTNQQGGVHLAWTVSADQSAVGTILYMATDSSGSGVTEIGRVQGDTATFDYTLTQGATDYFNIKAYDISGQASGYAGSWVAGISLYFNQLNYVRNGIFEDGESNWLFGTYTTHYALTGSSYLSIYGTAQGTLYNGTLTGPSDLPGTSYCGFTYGSQVMLAQDLWLNGATQLAPGNTFSFSAYFTTDGPGTESELSMSVRCYDASGTELSSTGNLAFSGISAPYAWARFKIENQTIPANTDRIRIAFISSAGLSAKGFLTGIQLEPYATANAWQPFMQEKSETHGITNLFTTTFVNDTSGWTLSGTAARTTSGIPAGCPVAPAAAITATTTGSTVAITLSRTLAKKQFVTLSIWSYVPAVYSPTLAPNTLPTNGQYLQVTDATSGISVYTMHPASQAGQWARLKLVVRVSPEMDGHQLSFTGNFVANGYLAAPQYELGNPGTEYKPQLIDLESTQTITGVKTFSANPVFNTGTWTPRFEGSTTAGTFTYSQQTGYYTRIGNVVFAQCYLGISAISVAPTGSQIMIRGLPFTVKSQTNGNAAASIGYLHNVNLSTNSLGLTAIGVQNSTDIYLYEYFDNAAAGFFPASQFTNASAALMLTIVYQV